MDSGEAMTATVRGSLFKNTIFLVIFWDLKWSVPYERHWTEFCAPTLHGKCYYSKIKAGYVIMKDFDYLNSKYPEFSTGWAKFRTM